jgi:hypothetical protein
MTRSQHVYEVRPRKDKRGVDLISDALPFGSAVVQLSPLVNTFINIGCLEFHPKQRLRFGEGTLRRKWFEQYPQLFDRDDFTRAGNRTRPYFFYEWLAAIVLHHSTGFLALVTRY